jgi:hypothetical protein
MTRSSSGSGFQITLPPLFLEPDDTSLEVEVLSAQRGQRSSSRTQVAGEGYAEQLVPAVASREETWHVAGRRRNDVDILRPLAPWPVDGIHRVGPSVDDSLLLEEPVVAAQHRDIERQRRLRNRRARLRLPSVAAAVA